MRISANLDSQKLKKIQKTFLNLENETRKVTGVASRRVAEKTKGFISDYASKEYYLTKGEVENAIKVFGGSGKTEAGLHLRGRKFSLIRFFVHASRTSPLQAGVLKGNSKLIPRAFVAISSKNGTPQVFFRKLSAKEFRNNLEVLRGPSIPQMIGTERAIKKIDTFVRAEIEKEISPKLNGILRGV